MHHAGTALTNCQGQSGLFPILDNGLPYWLELWVRSSVDASRLSLALQLYQDDGDPITGPDGIITVTTAAATTTAWERKRYAVVIPTDLGARWASVHASVHDAAGAITIYVDAMRFVPRGIDTEKGVSEEISANATLNGADRFTNANASSAAMTVTLPSVTSSNDGVEFEVRKADPTKNAVIVKPGGTGQGVDGLPAIALTRQGESARVKASLTSGGYHILSRDHHSPRHPYLYDRLKLWVAASHLVGIADGGSVTNMYDQSLEGYLLTQATSTKRPTLQTGEINGGGSVVRADGGDILKDTTFTGLSGVTSYTTMCVFKTERPATGNDFPFNTQAYNAGVQVLANELYLRAPGGEWGKFAYNKNTYNLITAEYDGTQLGDANRLKAWQGRTQKTLTFPFVGSIAAACAAESGISVLAEYAELVFLLGDLAELLIFVPKLPVKWREWEWDRLMSTYGLS
jgi:hypothetical protein